MERSSILGSYTQLPGKCHYSVLSGAVMLDCDLHKKFLSPITQSKYTTQETNERARLSKTTEAEAIRRAEEGRALKAVSFKGAQRAEEKQKQ